MDNLYKVKSEGIHFKVRARNEENARHYFGKDHPEREIDNISKMFDFDNGI